MFKIGRLAKEKEEDRQLKVKKTRMAKKNIRANVRTKNGSSGKSLTFYELQMPDGTKKKVRRSDGGSSGAKRSARKKVRT